MTKNFPYLCFRLQQRPGTPAPEFCMFTAKVGELMEWAKIERLPETPGAAQRGIKKSKVAAIRRYFELDSRNSIPSAAIVSLQTPLEAMTSIAVDGFPDGQLHVLTVTVEDGIMPGLIVDGQHRVLGMNKVDPNLPINVIALLNADDMEVAFQFLVINNKATKVPTDHIRALALEYEEKELDERLIKVRLNLDARYKYVGIANEDAASPFRTLIDLPSNRTGEKIVKPAAIEAALEDIERRQVRDFRDEETVLTFFFAIWETIKQRWPKAWALGKDSKLLSKAGIVSMTEYVTNALESAAFDWGALDVSDADAVRSKVNQLLDYQEEKFWSVEWASKSLDTKSGRELVVKALSMVSKNKRAHVPWYEDVELIDINQLEGLAEDDED